MENGPDQINELLGEFASEEILIQSVSADPFCQRLRVFVSGIASYDVGMHNPWAVYVRHGQGSRRHMHVLDWQDPSPLPGASSVFGGFLLASHGAHRENLLFTSECTIHRTHGRALAMCAMSGQSGRGTPFGFTGSGFVEKVVDSEKIEFYVQGTRAINLEVKIEELH